jgi:hypothetical protein
MGGSGEVEVVVIMLLTYIMSPGPLFRKKKFRVEKIERFVTVCSFALKVALEPCREPEEIIHQQLRDFWCKAH